jgi:Na+/phosphate symporter
MYLPLLVCIIGLLVYALSTNPKAQELGRIAFAFGLLVSLLLLNPRLVTVLR